MNRRILYSDNGTITDFSTNLNDYNNGSNTFTFVADDDAIFIGTPLPFNHTYIKASTTNADTSEMSVFHWDGKEFREMVEVIDETSLNGATLAQSGFISWVPNKDYGYIQEDTDIVTGLSSVTIYDRYWTKLTFSADFTAGIEWVGQLFSDDDDLGGEFPALVDSNLIAAIETGKTNYQEQHKIAADTIVKDLINQRDLIGENQILDREDLRLASVQKTAEIIFRMLGDDYEDARKLASLDYGQKLKRSYVKRDDNKNARIEEKERTPIFGKLTR